MVCQVISVHLMPVHVSCWVYWPIPKSCRDLVRLKACKQAVGIDKQPLTHQVQYGCRTGLIINDFVKTWMLHYLVDFCLQDFEIGFVSEA